MRLSGLRQSVQDWAMAFSPVVVIVFAVALALRVIFLATVEQIPIYGDMLTFSSTALGTGHFFVYGDIHPVVGDLYFRRGPFLPTVLAAAFAAYFRDPAILRSFDAVITRFNWDLIRYPQALVDSATCALIASLGLRLFDRRTALAGGLLAAVYPPLVLWVGAPLREVWLGFGLVASLWLWLAASERPDLRWPILAGTALGITGQTVPTLIGLGLIVPWMLGAALVQWRERAEWKVWARRVALAWAAYFSIWLARWALQFVMLGHLNLLTIGTGGTGGFWRFAATEGWIPDGTTVEQVSLGVIKGAGSAPEVLTGALAAFRASPLGWTGGLTANLYRIWLYPYNDFQQTFLLDWRGQVLVHWVVTALALVGLPLTAWLRPRSVYLILFPLYLSAFFGMDTVQSRYVAPVMPFICLVAGYAVVEIAAAVRQVKPTLPASLRLLAAATIAAIVRLPVILALLPALSPLTAQAIRTVGVVAAGLWLAVVVGRGLRQRCGSGPATLSLTCASLVLSAGFIYLSLGTPAWHTWSAELGGPLPGIHVAPGQFEQEIGLPPEGIVGGPAILLADLETNDSAALVVSVNGHIVKPAGQPITIRWEKFDDAFYHLWIQFKHEDLTFYRQWWEVPLPDGLLVGAESAVVTVWIDEGYPHAWVRVYGDYPSPLSDAGLFDGPRITLGPGDNANHRFHWDFSDPRLNGRRRLASTFTRAR